MRVRQRPRRGSPCRLQLQAYEVQRALLLAYATLER
jgi:hypothetical protein